MAYSKAIQVTIPLPLLYDYCRQYHKYIPPLQRPVKLIIENYCSNPYPLVERAKQEKRTSLGLSFRIPFGHSIILASNQLSVSAAVRILLYQHVISNQGTRLSDTEICTELAELLPKGFDVAPSQFAQQFSQDFSLPEIEEPKQIDLKKLVDKKVISNT